MLQRLFNVFRRNRLERDLDDEVRFHLDMLADEFRARGMSERDARLAARREFGAPDPVKEAYRDRRGVRWLEDGMQDLRYAARGLRRSPGFAIAAVLSLALGIGANTAVFSIFHALLLRTLPVERPRELVTLYRTGGWGEGFMSFPLYDMLNQQRHAFRGVLARSGTWKVRLGRPADGLQAIEREFVSGNYFDVLGVRPALGRVFSESETQGKNLVAVLSYDAWRNRFALDPSVLGKTLLVDEKPLTVVGVAGPRFSGIEPGRRTEVWVPLGMGDMPLNAGSHWLWAVGRRQPGVSGARLSAVAETVLARYLADNYGKGPDTGFKRMAMEQKLQVRPGGVGVSMLRSEFGQPLQVLLGAVSLIALIACANVAGLLLARGAARVRETAVRLSIGASRWRLVRQAIAESALIAALGGAVGWLVGVQGARSAASILPGARDGYVLDVQTGGPVLWWVLAASFVSALLVGLVPAFGATAIHPAAGLRESGAGSGRARVRLRKALVVAQVAVAVVLVGASALFARSLANLRGLDLGFHNRNVLTFSLQFPKGYGEERATGLRLRFRDRLDAVASIQSASAGFPGPFQGGSYSGDIHVPGSAARPGPRSVAGQFVYPRYFETIGTPLLRGRDIEPRDASGGRKVAVVNEAFVRDFLDGADPIGRAFGMSADGPADVTVVGLVPDIRHDGPRSQVAPMIYVAPNEKDPMEPVFAVRSTLPPRDLETLLRRELASMDPAIALSRPVTLGERIDESLLRDRIMAGLGLVFGGLAVLLAAVGIYGVTAFVVARRSSEIGVRIALGAAPRSVLWSVLRDGLAMAALGLILGAPVAWAANRLVRSLLFGVGPSDPAAAIATLAVLLLAAGAATAIPARRAASIDPARALRVE